MNYRTKTYIAGEWDGCNDPLKSCSGHNEWRSQT